MNMKPRKIEQHEKINYSPELQVHYHPRGDLQVLMRSPKFLRPPEGDVCTVDYIQAWKYAKIYDSDTVYETVKIMIKSITDLYYDYLLKTEMYEIPEQFKDSKALDTVIVEAEQ